MAVPTARTLEPFRGSEAVRDGLITWARLRGPDFQRLFPDVHAGARATRDVALRVKALSLWAGPGAVVSGPLAALAWDAECPVDHDEAIVPRQLRAPRPDVVVRRGTVEAAETDWRYATLVTTPVRTAFDLAARLPLDDAVAAVDALARPWSFGADELARLVVHHSGARGVEQVRRVLGLLDPAAESLMESRVRVRLVVRGVPAPVTQHPVRLPDGRGARLDLAWPDMRVALEYDGEEHRTVTRHGLDLDRDAALADLGWDVIHVTARQVYGDPDGLAELVLRRLAARSRRA